MFPHIQGYLISSRTNNSVQKVVLELFPSSGLPMKTELSDHLKHLVQKLCKPCSVKLESIDAKLEMAGKESDSPAVSSTATDMVTENEDNKKALCPVESAVVVRDQALLSQSDERLSASHSTREDIKSIPMEKIVEVITLDSDDEEPQRVQSNPLNEMVPYGTAVEKAKEPESFEQPTSDNCRKTPSPPQWKAVMRQHLLQSLNDSIKVSNNSYAIVYNAMLDVEREESAEDFAAVRVQLCKGLDRLLDYVQEAEATKALVKKLENEQGLQENGEM